MYSNLKRILQMLIINKCQLRWHQKWTSLSTKLNHIKHNIDNFIFPIKIPRQFEVILTRLRIGHTQIDNSILMTIGAIMEGGKLSFPIFSHSPPVFKRFYLKLIKVIETI